MSTTTPKKHSKIKGAEYAEAVALVASGARLEMTWEAIAEKVGVTKQTIFAWKRNPEFWDEVRAAMPHELQATVPEALAAVRREMKRSKGVAAIKAAELLLRAAGVIVDRVEQRSDVAVAQITPEALTAIDAALDRVIDAAGALPPAEVEETE